VRGLDGCGAWTGSVLIISGVAFGVIRQGGGFNRLIGWSHAYHSCDVCVNLLLDGNASIVGAEGLEFALHCQLVSFHWVFDDRG